MIQGYYYGIVRDVEFMPCTPTVAHLVPTLRTLFFATENLSLPSTPGTYNQEIQVALKLDLNPKLYKSLIVNLALSIHIQDTTWKIQKVSLLQLHGPQPI